MEARLAVFPPTASSPTEGPAVRRIALLLVLALVAGPLAASVAAASRPPALPSVHGGFGHAPTISFPRAAPPASLEVRVLRDGTGALVRRGDLVVANYVGQIWRGKVFDSSFGRLAAAFPIGVGQVIPGWDRALVGRRVGSRLLLVLPPADGYGKAGNPQAGITGSDTIVFVVDLLATYGRGAGADPRAVFLARSAHGVTVTGRPGKVPTVSVARDAPLPRAVSVAVLDRGHGRKIVPGLVVFQFVAVNLSSRKVATSTWKTGIPEDAPVGDPAQPSALDVLAGVRVGSRVLLEIPKSSSNPPYALAIDIVAEPATLG